MPSKYDCSARETAVTSKAAVVVRVNGNKATPTEKTDGAMLGAERQADT